MVTFSGPVEETTWVDLNQAVELRKRDGLPAKNRATLWRWAEKGYIRCKDMGGARFVAKEDVLSIIDVKAGRPDVSGTARPKFVNGEVRAAVKAKTRDLRHCFPGCYTEVISYEPAGFGVAAWSDEDKIVPLGKYPVA
jgi:hypothetical protein